MFNSVTSVHLKPASRSGKITHSAKWEETVAQHLADSEHTCMIILHKWEYLRTNNSRKHSSKKTHKQQWAQRYPTALATRETCIKATVRHSTPAGVAATTERQICTTWKLELPYIIGRNEKGADVGNILPVLQMTHHKIAIWLSDS